jgi:hypothetical protein
MRGLIILRRSITLLSEIRDKNLLCQLFLELQKCAEIFPLAFFKLKRLAIENHFDFVMNSFLPNFNE